MKRLITLALLLATAAGFAASPATASAQSPWNDTSNSTSTYTDQQHSCLSSENHEYEVCTAYVANASTAVLAPYYKYANSTNQSTRNYVTYRLGSRYYGAAYGLMRQRTDGWPAGTNHVNVPVIHISSVDSDLANNTATLQTVESWRVTDSRGNVLYEEDGQGHRVSMERVPSYVLHKWVVTSIQ